MTLLAPRMRSTQLGAVFHWKFQRCAKPSISFVKSLDASAQSAVVPPSRTLALPRLSGLVPNC
jgi:hypothetical protein